MKEKLIEYYNELNKEHKGYKQIISVMKKQLTFRELMEWKQGHQEIIDRIKNIKEQKLHIKRLIKLMKEGETI